MFRPLFASLLVFAVVVGGLTAQSAAELKDRRNRLLRELATTTKRLKATKAQKSKAIRSLGLLRQQIEQRRELIATLDEEIALTNERIADNQDILTALAADLDRMRAEYGQTLRAVYRNKLTQGWLGFLFSAESWNDAFRRYQYLRQYQRYRRKQSRLIVATQESMRSRTIELEIQRVEKEELLTVANEQGAALENALDTQVGLLDELKGEEKKLFARIEKQRSERAALDKAIEKAIAAEMANSSAEEDNDLPAVGSTFAAQRGRLGWPARGEVIKPFGRQPHPDVPSVTVYNGGIDLDVGAEARIQAVYAGRVISIRQIPGFRNTVMVRHGDYYTVYSNLDRVVAARGDEVERGTTLGFAGPTGELHFELWRGKKRLDPGRWLR